MKYTVLVNQAGVVDAGLADQTDIVDWAVLDYIQTWTTNPKATRRGDLVWLNYRHLIDEMPLLGLRSKSSVGSRIEKLRNLGLITTIQDDDKRLYVGLTELFHRAVNFRTTVHPDEQGVREDEQGVRPDEHSYNNHIQPSKPIDPEAKLPPCPAEKIIALYHQNFPVGSKVLISRFKGSKREKHLTARWREDERHRSLDFWVEYFSAAADIEWLTGKNSRDWIADFEYLTSRRGFDRVLEQVVDHA